MAGAAAATDRRECGRPGADLALGAQFALGCLAAPAGPTRDVLFQLAFAAYVGACVNLNPFLGRDLLRSAVRPERCWMSMARASCATWGEEVEGPA